MLYLVLLLLAAAVIGVIFIVSMYNGLVTMRSRFENAFAQIEIQLKRRYDLIPSIAESVKGYMKHENDTLLKVIAARNDAAAALKDASAKPSDAEAIKRLNMAESKLSGSLGNLNVQLEAYPDLKASSVMRDFIEELRSTENKVAFARQAFNDSVTTYNIKRNTMPTCFFAAAFGHPADAVLLNFDDSEAIQAAPKVSF